MVRKLSFEQLLIVLPKAIEEKLWVQAKVFFLLSKKATTHELAP